MTRPAISRTVAFAQGKGGVGKTTCATNVAGLAALIPGIRVLVVDLDPQGNVARDLGYEPDSGKALHDALLVSGDLPILRDVREKLDVVPGGPQIGFLPDYFASRARQGSEGFGAALHESLQRVAGGYDLILIDTPPGDRVIVDGVLETVRSVIIPTRSDDASIDGVERVAERFLSVRDRNPALTLAGVVLFAISARATRLEDRVRTNLEAMLDQAAPVFRSRIREQSGAAADARRYGMLVHELEANAPTDAERLRQLREGRDMPVKFHARNTTGLAEDFEALTKEILERVAQIEQGE